MSKHSLATLLLLAAGALNGCTAGPAHVPALNGGLVQQARTAQVPGGGTFTEYPMPPGANPAVFTKGPNGTLWFDSNVGGLYANGYNMYRFTESNGSVATFSQPSPLTAVTNPVTTNNLMYFVMLNPYGQGENPEYLDYSTSSGTISQVGSNQVGSDEQMGTLVLGPDGNLWFPDCVQVCTETPDGFLRSITTAGGGGVTVTLTNFDANQLTPGPLGYLYVTASYSLYYPPPPPNDDSHVYVVSTSGSIAHVFKLPHGSAPNGIASGPDHNLWIAEPGINKIARMTPAGTIKQFTVPTANAGAAWITGGADGALWFTETNANKIGRLTTSGGFREWNIPTANAGAGYITYCYPNCGPHSGVWFSETTANQIGRFEAPI